MTTEYELSDLLYENPLACPGDVDGWRLEDFPSNLTVHAVRAAEKPA
ncbi:MAG TPA: hypothetical protein VMZ50_05295 [Phycisphaerae bacterium]|nr:hypothetical protein [Phycisphaerae bacterium]